MLIGPQGTENNPISEENFEKLRKKAAWIILIYLIITFFMLSENLKVLVKKSVGNFLNQQQLPITDIFYAVPIAFLSDCAQG